MAHDIPYTGFELGPIRPPSEANSLLLRVTRNCPWNQCTFCWVYKGEKFSRRPVAHLIRDIDTVARYVDVLRELPETDPGARHQAIMAAFETVPEEDHEAFQAALVWTRGGCRSVFLQDADSLVIKPDDLMAILTHVRRRFPDVERVTSFARSKSIAKIPDADLEGIAAAGLNRIHIGMESASDTVLKFVKKGADKETHILAGQKVKRAGMQLSEYYIAGLGGHALSREHALESADALNRINPDFIRIRSLSVPDTIPLADDVREGRLTVPNDVEQAEEILFFLEHLDGITSRITSDHIVNLLQEVEGVLPDDKAAICAPVRAFLSMVPAQQLLYRVGRRTGVFKSLDDLKKPGMVRHAEAAIFKYGITKDNIDDFTKHMMAEYI